MGTSLKFFFIALQIIFQVEGGWYSGDGGTNYGIRASTLKTANELGIVRQTNIRKITRGDAAKIYHKMYWIPSGAGSLNWPLCLVVFDAAVHSGVGKSRELLRLSQDALKAEGNQKHVALQMVVERWKHLKSLSKFSKQPGWRRRMNTILSHVIAPAKLPLKREVVKTNGQGEHQQALRKTSQSAGTNNLRSLRRPKSRRNNGKP